MVLQNIDAARLIAMCTRFQAKYKVLEKIGEGSFSEVLKCRDRQSGILYAAKRLKRTYQNVDEILESPEVMTMRKMTRHPNVLYMIESHYDALPGRVTLIFELMDMSLYDLIRNRKGQLIIEVRVKAYLYQLLKGLQHLHKHGLFHRDIKPENILLKGSAVKIGDLGSARDVYGRPPYTEYISTRWYRSPECILTGGFYGPKMDVWAAGCVFYELLTLEPLFPGENEVDQIAKIHGILGTPHARLLAKIRRTSSRTRSADLYFPAREGRSLGRLLPGLSSTGLDVLERMLVYDPENRPTAKRLLDHRYFADLREREIARQTRSSVIMGSYCGDDGQVLLSYFASSDRQRRLGPANGCQSETRYRFARIVESRPKAAALPSFSSVDARSHEEFRSSKCFRKRPSLQSNVIGMLQAKQWHDSTGKSSSVKCVDAKDRQEESAPSVKPRDAPQRRSFYLHARKSSPRGDKAEPRSSQLPCIAAKSSRNVMYTWDTTIAYGLGESSCRGREQQYRVPTRKASAIQSPAKKVARCELGKGRSLKSMSFDSRELDKFQG